MKIRDIIAKLLAGTALTDEEKAFAEKYDEQSLINAAAAEARRKAEAKEAEAKAQLEALKNQSKQDADKKDASYNALAERVKALETAKNEADAKLARIDRQAKIKAAFDKAGIKAAKGVPEATFQKLVDIATEGVEIEKDEALNTAIAAFKQEYTGIIASEGASGTGRVHKGAESTVASDDNPWAKGHENLTKQCEIAMKDPAKATQLKQAAASQAQGENK